MPFGDLLTAVAAKTPSPGGGAVGCAAGALAAALAGMVVAYSIGKKDLAPHKDALTKAQADLGRARAMFLTLADEDAAAYGLLNELQKLPATDPRRLAEYDSAVHAAVTVPLAAVAASEELARRCAALATTTNPHLASDLVIAAILAAAAAESSACNVRINFPLMSDHALRDTMEQNMNAMLARTHGFADSVKSALG